MFRSTYYDIRLPGLMKCNCFYLCVSMCALFYFLGVTLTAGVEATSAGASPSDCGTWPPVTTWPWQRIGGWCCRTGRGPIPSPPPSASEPRRLGHTYAHRYKGTRCPLKVTGVTRDHPRTFSLNPTGKQLHRMNRPLSLDWKMTWTKKITGISESIAIEVNLAELADSD